MAAKNLSHPKSYNFEGCSKSNHCQWSKKAIFLPLNGADFDQVGSCSWSPGGQLAATPWPLPTAPWPPPPNWLPWPRHPLTNEASPALPSANQSGWSLASDWLHQWEGLIAGLEQELLTGTGGWVPLTMPGPTPLAATTGIHKSLPKRARPCVFCPFPLDCEDIVLWGNRL